MHLGPHRFLLPLSSGMTLPPRRGVLITARPQTPKFYPERLLIKDASHWNIDTIHVGPRAGALVKDLPGAVFAPDVPGHFPGCGEIEIPPGGELIIGVTYTGAREGGIPFEACVFGSDDQPTFTPVVRWKGEERLATVRSSGVVAPNMSERLSTSPMKHDAWLSRLVVEDASDWVVNDVRVGDVSIFAQSGDVPGSLTLV